MSGHFLSHFVVAGEERRKTNFRPVIRYSWFKIQYFAMSRRGGIRDSPLDCKVYVGDLSKEASDKELERAFSYYGPLRNVWVARNPAGFAFVEFEDQRDADDAVRGLDGSNICGSRVRVEMSSGKVRPKPWMRRGGGGGGRGGGGRGGRREFDPNDRCYECGDHGHYAYDCPGSRGGRGRRRSRSRSVDRRRSFSRSRSRSRGRYRNRSVSRSPRRNSRDRNRSVSRSPRRNSRERRYRSRSPRFNDRSRSRSPRSN